MTVVNQETKIWLANLGSQPVDVPGGQVVTLAKWVSETEDKERGDDSDGKDEVDGMVRQTARHLREGECQELEEA